MAHAFFLAAGTAEQIWLSILLFFFFFSLLFSNLYPSCQNWVSFGPLDYERIPPFGSLCPSGHFALRGTLPFGALWPSWHFDLLGTLTFGALCTSGYFAFRGALPFLDQGTLPFFLWLLFPLRPFTFLVIQSFEFFSSCQQLWLKDLQSCFLPGTKSNWYSAFQKTRFFAIYEAKWCALKLK